MIVKIYCDDDYVFKILNNNVKKILDFFKIKPNQNITVKVLNIKDFQKEFEEYLNYPINSNVTGFIEDDRKTIVYLDYSQWKYTSHKKEKIEEYDKVIVHELVHMIHSIFCNYNYPDDDLFEGVAYFLATQTNNSYYDNFAHLVKQTTHEELLKILNREQ